MVCVSVQFSSVQSTQSCPTLCDPMNCSMPGLPVYHQLPGFTETQRPLSQWCHPAILSSVVPFSSCPQSLPASESFPMSQPFAVICNVLLLVWKEKELLFPSNCVYFLGGEGRAANIQFWSLYLKKSHPSCLALSFIIQIVNKAACQCIKVISIKILRIFQGRHRSQS